MDDLPITPPANETPTPSKQTRVILVAIGAIIIIGAALLFGDKFYYQVFPLNQTGPTAVMEGEPCDLAENPACLPFKEALASAAISVHQMDQCSYFTVMQDSNGTLSTTSLKRIGEDLCKRIVDSGAQIVEQPLATPGRNLYGHGSHIGSGIVSSNGTYLVSFFLRIDENSQYSFLLTRVVMLKAKTVSSLAEVPVGDPALDLFALRVTGTDASGMPTEEYFGHDDSRDSDGSYSVFLTRHSDGTFSRQVSNQYYFMPLRASFSIPYPNLGGTGVREMYGDRDIGIESQNNVEPIYHPESCGFEQAYADTSFWVSPATFFIHFGTSPTLYFTTPRYGYAPELWGKIVGQLSVESFRAKVMEAGSVSGSSVEMLDIGGYRVKHVGPFLLDRACSQGSDASVTYDMYQAVKNGAVVTMRVVNNKQTHTTDADAEQLFKQVITTLSFRAP